MTWNEWGEGGGREGGSIGLKSSRRGRKGYWGGEGVVCWLFGGIRG